MVFVFFLTFLVEKVMFSPRKPPNLFLGKPISCISKPQVWHICSNLKYSETGVGIVLYFTDTLDRTYNFKFVPINRLKHGVAAVICKFQSAFILLEEKCGWSLYTLPIYRISVISENIQLFPPTI